MSIKIIKTNTTKEGSRGLIYAMAERNVENSRHIFVVPDRFTLSVEQEICDKVCENGCYNVDVVSFTRLAIKLLRNRLKKCLSKEGTVILLNKIIREQSENLNYYKDITSFNFSKEMFASIASLRDSKITAEDIIAKVKTVDGVTKNKLLDIAILYKEYLNAITGNFADTISRIDSLIEAIPTLPEIGNTDFYFLGFNIYSQQQFNLIKQCMRYARSVNIAFSTDSGGANHGIFITHQAQDLEDFAKEIKVECKVEERIEVLPNNFMLLHQNMFGYASQNLPFDKNVNQQIVLYAERNPYEEIKSVAREIQYLVTKNDYRYKEIAVVVAEDSYKRIIEEIFTRYDIPYFVDTKYYVKNSLAVKFINSLFGVVENNYNRLDILKLAHHPFWKFSGKQLRQFENYIVGYNINYTRFTQKFTLGDFAVAEEMRQFIVGKVALIDKGVMNIGQYCQTVIKILHDENILEILKSFSESTDLRLRSSIDIDDFCVVLEEIQEVNGNLKVSLGEFCSIYNSAIADMGKGVLPQNIDSVFVGATKDSRFQNIKALFIVDASSGNFPLVSGDNVIFTAFDSENMKKSGLNVYPTSIDNNNLEKMVVVDLLAKPCCKLYVGYSSSNISGEQLLIGEGLSELMHLLCVDKLGELSKYHNFDEKEYLEYYLVNAKNAYFEYTRNNIPPKFIASVQQYLISKEMFFPKAEKVNADINYQDYLLRKENGVFQTSVSQLESYFNCPFYHYCKYGLGLQEQEEGIMKDNIIGTLIHNILEEYFKTFKNVLRESSEIKIKEFIDISIKKVVNDEKYARYKIEGYGKFSFDNVVKESKKLLLVLTEYVKQSKFTPTYLEMGFGKKTTDKSLQVSVNGDKYNFVGKVDRVDTYENKVAIIDYKTGSVSESLQNVYYGKKIQLYLYLKVFLDEGKIPAGVFYMPIKSNYNKDGSSYSLVGQISNDFETFSQLDTNFCSATDDFSSKIVDFRAKKYKTKGEWSFTSRTNALKTEEFSQICDYTVEISRIALAEISSGYNAKKPVKGSCDFCSFRKLCGEVEERSIIGGGSADCFVAEVENE